MAGLLHVASRTHRRGKSIRTLCGFWNAPTLESPGWASSKGKLPKQVCPACRRLYEGGKR